MKTASVKVGSNSKAKLVLKLMVLIRLQVEDDGDQVTTGNSGEQGTNEDSELGGNPRLH